MDWRARDDSVRPNVGTEPDALHKDDKYHTAESTDVGRLRRLAVASALLALQLFVVVVSHRYQWAPMLAHYPDRLCRWSVLPLYRLQRPTAAVALARLLNCSVTPRTNAPQRTETESIRIRAKQIEYV